MLILKAWLFYVLMSWNGEGGGEGTKSDSWDQLFPKCHRRQKSAPQRASIDPPHPARVTLGSKAKAAVGPCQIVPYNGKAAWITRKSTECSQKTWI